MTTVQGKGEGEEGREGKREAWTSIYGGCSQTLWGASTRMDDAVRFLSCTQNEVHTKEVYSCTHPLQNLNTPDSV